MSFDDRYFLDNSKVVIKGNTLRGTFQDFEISLRKLFDLYSLSIREEFKFKDENTPYILPLTTLADTFVINTDFDIENFKIGKTPQGGEIYPSTKIIANDPISGIFKVGVFYKEPLKIYFSGEGLKEGTNIKIYLR